MIISLKRLASLFTHPREYFAGQDISILDGFIVIILLFLATFFQKLVWVGPGSPAVSPLPALGQAAINSFMVWSLYCIFFFAVAGIFRKSTNIVKLSGMVGAAGLPLVISTLLSGLSWWVVSLANLTPNIAQWLFIQNGLSWLGLVLSWPGLLGFFLLRDGLKLPKGWSIALIVAAFGLLIVAKFIAFI
jgi:hypothetical protein